ncbi:MAG: hypothetical protein WD830_11505 [Chloroflexota bacterium]
MIRNLPPAARFALVLGVTWLPTTLVLSLVLGDGLLHGIVYGVLGGIVVFGTSYLMSRRFRPPA